MFDLTGKKALVTGSTQGIGLAIARVLSDAGATVYINGMDEQRGMRAVNEIKNARLALGDLSQPDIADRLYEITGPVDILILNASVQFRSLWYEITDEQFDKQVAVNFKSTLKLIQKYTPYMQKQKWGRIITLGSIQQRVMNKNTVVYGALKAAVENMVRSFAKMLAPDNITVNNVAPGVILTARNREALSNEAYCKQIIDGIPAGYVGEPKDCAGLFLLLCSDEGKYMTGEDIFIDGGMKL